MILHVQMLLYQQEWIMVSSLWCHSSSACCIDVVCICYYTLLFTSSTPLSRKSVYIRVHIHVHVHVCVPRDCVELLILYN